MSEATSLSGRSSPLFEEAHSPVAGATPQAPPLCVSFKRAWYRVDQADNNAPGVLHDPHRPIRVPSASALTDVLNSRSWERGGLAYATPLDVVVLYGRGNQGEASTSPVWYAHFEVEGEAAVTRRLRPIPPAVFRRIAAELKSDPVLLDSPLLHMLPSGGHPKPLNPVLNGFQPVPYQRAPKGKRARDAQVVRGGSEASVEEVQELLSDDTADVWGEAHRGAKGFKLRRVSATQTFQFDVGEGASRVSLTPPRGATSGRVHIEWGFGVGWE